MKELVVTLFLCFVLAEVAAGQAPSPTMGGVPKRKFGHGTEIVSLYDQAKDQTTVIMDWYLVYTGSLDPNRFNQLSYDANVRTNRGYIKAAFAYPGRVLSSIPDAVEFALRISRQGGPLFKENETPELSAIVDGETISLGKASLGKTDTRIFGGDDWQTSSAELFARFTYTGLLRIVRAKKVDMRIGKLQFKLREENLEALRDLASRMVPGG